MSVTRDTGIQAALLAIVAMATSASAQAQAQEAQAASGEEFSGLGEILVTAQRRTESLQDVPISLSAIGGDEIAALRVSDPSDLTRVAPSFNIATAQGVRPQIGIRGVGTQRFDIGSDSPVGVFVDDVYRARFSAISAAFFDLERVEVLRGPQDILFGRNTPAGALSIITAGPTAFSSGYIDAAYSNENHVHVEGAASGPLLSDQILFRLAGLYDEADGFSTDTTSGHTSGEQNFALRGKLQAELSPSWTATLALDWHRAEMDLVYNEPGPQPRFLALPNLPFVPTPDPFSEPMTYPGFVEREQAGSSLDLTYEGQGVNFVSLTAFRGNDLSQEEDFDYTILDVGMNRSWEQSEQVSQEFRLSSLPGGPFTFGDRLEWLIGAFLYQDDASRIDQLNFGGDSLFNPNHLFSPTFVSIDLPADIVTQSWSVFAQAGVSITDRLRLTLGGRYTEDTKDYRLQSQSAFGATLGIPLYDISGSETWDAFDPKVVVSYDLNDDALVYASWSEGFKSGGFQFAASIGAVAELVYEPEQVTAYELGFKADWLDNHLRTNFSAFQYDYVDQQVQSVIVVGNLPTVVTTNAAQSHIWGAEADISAVPIEGLTLSLRYAYLNAAYDKFIQDPFTNTDLSGFRMPRTPENSVTLSANYEHTALGDWRWFSGADYFYTDGFESSSNQDPSQHINSYAILSARLGLLSPDQRVRLTLFGANLTDEVYKTYAINQGPSRNYGYGDPRTIGISVGYRY